jgi:hypothetical protein
MSRVDRVIFFSKRDMMASHMLGKAEKLLEGPPDFSVLDLNALLEFHHIHQYFEHGLFLTHWTENQLLGYKKVVKDALAAIRKFLLGLAPEHLIPEIEKLEFNNWENFWQLFGYFELYKKHDRQIFVEILSAFPRHIRDILPIAQLVQFYNNELRSFLFTYEDSAEILLGHYEQKQTDEPSDYRFPKSLSETDKESIIEAYLDTEDPNLNFVDLARNARTIKLSPKVRLKAKQTSSRITEKILTGDNSYRIGVGASLAKDQVEPVILEEQESGDTIAIYGGGYLDKLRTDMELFNVFSNLFLYTDEEGLISLVNKDAEMDTLEKIFMQSKNEYQKGIVFERKSMLSMAQLGIFSHYLKDSERSIESVINNFVHTFFKDWFGMQNLVFNMPSTELNPAEKIRLIAPELDYLLRQFQNFVTDGAIDHELLRLDSAPVHFSNVPSLVGKKYVFSTHEKIRLLQHWFFDPNSILADRKADIENRQTVFQTLATKRTLKSDLEDYQLAYLERIVEDGFLHIDEDGVIEMVDPVLIFIAGKLRENGFISYWHIAQPFRDAMDRLLDEGYLEVSDRLFTANEVSYLNFHLNMKEFSNSKDLRNKYLHGSHDRDEKHQEMDYLYFLRTLIVILIKLRDDAILKRSYFTNGDLEG